MLKSEFTAGDVAEADFARLPLLLRGCLWADSTWGFPKIGDPNLVPFIVGSLL